VTPVEFALVFLGGGSGAVCRYLAGRFVGERYGAAFPLGTCLINVSGCFALGLVATLLAGTPHASALTALLATGFLGGFTTFSTYALETLVLVIDGAHGTALLNLAAPVALGLPAAALGALAGRGL
jgi:CrcB protein